MAEVTPNLINVGVNPSLDTVKERWGKRFEELKDKSVPYKKASIYLDRWVQLNFRTEGGRVGGWQKSRAAERRHGKTLQDTGRLRASFIPWATRRNAGIGSDVPYSETHEKGLDGMPVRRMLPKRKEVIADIRLIFNAHVQSAFAGMMKGAKGVGKSFKGGD